MRINLKQPILDYEGKAIKTSELDENNAPKRDKDGQPILVNETVRTYFFGALNSVTHSETLTSEEKARIYQLTKKLFATNDVDLTPNERELIKRRVESIYGSPMICGRLIDILYPEDIQAEQSELVPEEDKALATAKK